MTLQQSVRKPLLAAMIAVASGILFVNIYNSVVDVPNWTASIESARNYFGTANPGSFFRIVSPLNQVLGLVALALCWKADRRLRWLCLAGLLVAVATDAFTFGYFYPRNAVMFEAPINQALIEKARSEWASMNWLRSGMVAANLCLAFAALFRLNSIEKRA